MSHRSSTVTSGGTQEFTHQKPPWWMVCGVVCVVYSYAIVTPNDESTSSHENDDGGTRGSQEKQMPHQPHRIHCIVYSYCHERWNYIVGGYSLSKTVGWNLSCQR